MEGGNKISRFESIRIKLESNIGEKVRIKFSHSNKAKTVIREAILLQVHPHVFTLRIFHPSYEETASFTYADLYAKAVELSM